VTFNTIPPVLSCGGITFSLHDQIIRRAQNLHPVMENLPMPNIKSEWLKMKRNFSFHKLEMKKRAKDTCIVADLVMKAQVVGNVSASKKI